MRSRLEQDVAAGTVTRRAVRIFRESLLQLALAPFGRRLLGPPLPLPFPVTPTLLAAALLALRRRSIPVGGPPALPVPGFRLAFLPAITAVNMTGREQPLAPLQQAATQPPAGRSLKGIIGYGILRRAQGSLRSHRSSLGAELPTSVPGRYLCLLGDHQLTRHLRRVQRRRNLPMGHPWLPMVPPHSAQLWCPWAPSTYQRASAETRPGAPKSVLSSIAANTIAM